MVVGFLKEGEYRADLHGVADPHGERRNPSGPVGAHDVPHLHGLDDKQFLCGTDLVADGDAQGDDGPWQRCPQRPLVANLAGFREPVDLGEGHGSGIAVDLEPNSARWFSAAGVWAGVAGDTPTADNSVDLHDHFVRRPRKRHDERHD